MISPERPVKLTQALLLAGKGDQNPGKVDLLPEISGLSDRLKW